MITDLVSKYAVPIPRYTSYPTALSFSQEIGPGSYENWLGGLSVDDPLSLYVHIPFCKTVCWYCGCHAKAARRKEPIARYLKALEAEISLVAKAIPDGCIVKNLHWGGGSPNSLEAEDIDFLNHTLRKNFHIDVEAQYAVEVDPRNLSSQQADAFKRAGVNRVSLGVQDFDDKVQGAIGRIQSFETTMAVANLLRDHGIEALNIDLVYGLPEQTLSSADKTIDGVLTLDPVRIALFGYAHLPKKISRQRLINETALPGPELRFELANQMAGRLTAAGYQRIGLDHFAKPGDPLSQGRVRRNFQGYTSDEAMTLIGLGVTAISQLPDGYAQNAVPVHDYERSVMAGKYATVRGYALNDEDRMRALAIERLMCDLAFPTDELCERFGAAAKPLLVIARDVLVSDNDGLVEAFENGFRVTEKGRPFLRAISSCFDAHLNANQAAYSSGV